MLVKGPALFVIPAGSQKLKDTLSGRLWKMHIKWHWILSLLWGKVPEVSEDTEVPKFILKSKDSIFEKVPEFPNLFNI